MFVTEASGGWTDPGYVSLLKEANASVDPSERSAKLAATEGALLRAMPIIPLYHQPAHYLRKPYVQALDPDPLEAHHFRYSWIDKNWKPTAQ